MQRAMHAGGRWSARLMATRAQAQLRFGGRLGARFDTLPSHTEHGWHACDSATSRRAPGPQRLRNADDGRCSNGTEVATVERRRIRIAQKEQFTLGERPALRP